MESTISEKRDDDERHLGRAVDGGDQGQEDEESVADEEHPGDDLLRMQGQLESVKTPPFPELLDRGAGAGSGRHPEDRVEPLIGDGISVFLLVTWTCS